MNEIHTDTGMVAEKYQEIPIEDFDQLAREKQFRHGPHISTFGDGQGEPYNSLRRVWGTLNDGRLVMSFKQFN